MAQIMQQGTIAFESVEGLIGNCCDVRSKLRFTLVNKGHRLANNDSVVSFEGKSFGFPDLSIVVAVPIDDSEAVAYVAEEMLGMWGITREQLYNDAWNSTSEKCEVKTLAGLMSELMGLPMPVKSGSPEVYVVSYKDRCLGSGAILTQLDKFRRMFPDGFTVLPSSRHEVLVVEGYNGVYNEMVRTVNCDIVDEEDFLSDSTYEF